MGICQLSCAFLELFTASLFPTPQGKIKKKSLLLFQNIYSVTGKKKVNMNIFFSLEMPLVLNKDMMICMFYLENFDTQKQFAFRQNLNYFLREY